MDDTPQITIQDFVGRHNFDLSKSIDRLSKSRTYADLSTVCIIPNNGLINARVAENWMNQTSQMNQKFMRIMMIGMEKYHGYNTCIENILATPGLNTFKYILTMEEDVLPPFDALQRLFESIETFDVVGGLAWTTGMSGYPMVYGDSHSLLQTYNPVMPYPETVQPCFGVGTAFTLFKLDIFKNEKLTKPWFKADPRRDPGKFTNDKPDMSFFENIHKLNYKVACDTRVRLGRYDVENDIVW